jgi:hypothetical protein
MIRQPIKRSVAISLGIASLALLLGAYTWLSHRQHAQNPDDTTIPTWGQLGRGIKTAIEVNPRSNERWLVVDAKASGYRLFAGLGRRFSIRRWRCLRKFHRQRRWRFSSCWWARILRCISR